MGACEQGALAQHLAGRTEDHQDAGESGAHHQSVCRREQRSVTRSVGLCASDDGAVGDDQGDEDPEDAVEIVEPGIHPQLYRGDQRRNDDDEDRYADLLLHLVTDERDDEVRADQDYRRGDAQAQAVDRARGDGE